MTGRLLARALLVRTTGVPRVSVALVGLALTLWLAAPRVVLAHDVMYPGTVTTVEAAHLQVRTVDPDSKKAVTLWFTVTKDTQVKRGERVVTYAEAKVQKDERVVVIINHEEMGSETAAKEVRLAAKTVGASRAREGGR